MICHVTITTEDMDRTVEFYQWLLGLPVDRRFPFGEGGEIVFLGADETKFEIISQPDVPVKATDGVTIGFAVTDLEEKIRLLDSRNIPHSPVLSPNPVARFCFFNDLNGVHIQLFEGH